jgi:glycogen debranching enzyme
VRAEEILEVNDRFYVLATSDRLDDRTRVLKQGDTFAVFDRHGDIRDLGRGEQGLYHDGTRFLSRLELHMAGWPLLLLSSTVKRSAALLTADLTNPDVHVDGSLVLERGLIHVFRSKFLWRASCYETVDVTNFGTQRVAFELGASIDADFADVFEVRGFLREKRGDRHEPEVSEGCLLLGYQGLDGIRRRTRIHALPAPRVVGTDLRFPLELEAGGSARILITTSCETGEGATSVSFPAAEREAAEAASRLENGASRLETPSVRWNEWLARSIADVSMMVTETEAGPYPYAGIPWFSAPFGRDGVITALECLWFDPSIARGVLSFLAATQATESIPEQDAEPGKILHEMHRGELAQLGEVPFGRYYGSVDATPLFVVLAGAYHERTRDRDLVAALWPSVESALAWIDRASDARGFLTYQRRSPRGLVHQGWKDSADSVFHADGTLAPAPIALCEVQGYVHLAKLRAAELAAVLGLEDRAAQLAAQARTLGDRFRSAFWSDAIGSYVLALDGEGKPCEVRTSNAGQCLFTRVATPEHARCLAATLLRPEFFSGWGVRTVARGERRYNPMSYHNGSVWPHDNALLAWGLALHGFKQEMLRVVNALFDASLYMDLRRMPELFCGFERRPDEGPTAYPVACTPQAWSAGSVLLLLQACLGLSVSAVSGEIRFDRPLLPASLNELQIRDLRVGDAFVDLDLTRHGFDVGVNVLRREGPIEILVVE